MRFVIYMKISSILAQPQLCSSISLEVMIEERRWVVVVITALRELGGPHRELGRLWRQLGGPWRQLRGFYWQLVRLLRQVGGPGSPTPAL